MSFVEAGIGTQESTVECLHSRPVVSDGTLAEDVIDHFREAADCTEFPRAQRFGSRPPLARVFLGVSSRSDRDARAVTAVCDHGYTMKEVADFLHLHYITVSRALARADRLPPVDGMSECKT